MSSAIADARKFKSLLRSLPKVETAEPDGAALDTLVESFLMWKTTTDKAVSAFGKIRQQIVDYNDLRVSMPQEIVEMIGERYPQASIRAERLRACLRDLYLREHAMTMEGLADAGKRDVRKYVDTLEGMVPYVASRVMLLRFDVHAIPVDEQLRDRLADEGVTDADADPVELSSWLTRQVKAGTGAETHAALQAWVDTGRPRAARTVKKKAASRAAAATKKTTKKKTASTRRKTTGRKPASKS